MGPPYRATLAPVALSRGIPLNAVIPNLPSSSPECCHASHQTHLARLFNLEIGFNNTPSPPSPLSWITASPTILDRGPLHVALAILAPMAGRRCVMAVGAIDGQPSPLGDNALWQPNSPPPCPPLPHLARQQMHCGRSHQPWVVDTSLTAHSTVFAFIHFDSFCIV